MISALKRLVNSNDNGTKTVASDGTAATTAVASTANGNTANGCTSSQQSTSNNSNSKTTTSILNNGMHMISQSLQKKFARGVNYNSNIFCVFLF